MGCGGTFHPGIGQFAGGQCLLRFVAEHPALAWCAGSELSLARHLAERAVAEVFAESWLGRAAHWEMRQVRGEEAEVVVTD